MCYNQQNQITPKQAQKQSKCNMNQIRKFKTAKKMPTKTYETKNTFKLSQIQQQLIVGNKVNPEQSAKNNLIELSHTNFLARQQQINQPDLKLKTQHDQEDIYINLNSVYSQSKQTQSKRPSSKRISLWGKSYQLNRYHQYEKDNIIKQFMKLSQGLDSLSQMRRNSTKSQRSNNYQFGDRSICISLRNPVSVSSYVVTGCKNNLNQTRYHSTPPISQYVIRQQRNASKLKKCKSKNEQNNLIQRTNNLRNTKRVMISDSSFKSCRSEKSQNSAQKAQIKKLSRTNITFVQSQLSNQSQQTNKTQICFKNNKKSQPILF